MADTNVEFEFCLVNTYLGLIGDVYYCLAKHESIEFSYLQHGLTNEQFIHFLTHKLWVIWDQLPEHHKIGWNTLINDTLTTYDKYMSRSQSDDIKRLLKD